MFYDILEGKNAFLGSKNKKLNKSKFDIFAKGFAMVLLKNWPFFQFFFLGNIGQKNVLYDILERKNAFVGNKNKKFNKSKN